MVHVTSVCPPDKRLGLSDLFSRKSPSWRRRQLVFETDLSTFLAGDLVHEFIQKEAMCLLRDLVLAVARLATPVSIPSVYQPGFIYEMMSNS